VGITADTSAFNSEPSETARTGCNRLRSSGIVSASRSHVCMDGIEGCANDLGTSKLFYGIRCMLFPIASRI
jgi:hypothetical protein